MAVPCPVENDVPDPVNVFAPLVNETVPVTETAATEFVASDKKKVFAPTMFFEPFVTDTTPEVLSRTGVVSEVPVNVVLITLIALATVIAGSNATVTLNDVSVVGVLATVLICPAIMITSPARTCVTKIVPTPVTVVDDAVAVPCNVSFLSH